ncbi:hypothetical protein M5K25_004524 [Dendrobium thyrsiflorum]|uniref:F-box domain-containing protein n=1 Tax=Dendrobium thyrsiflorum TaxID=117978 RepID=A0ABD0VM29_DENTH
MIKQLEGVPGIKWKSSTEPVLELKGNPNSGASTSRSLTWRCSKTKRFYKELSKKSSNPNKRSKLKEKRTILQKIINNLEDYRQPVRRPITLADFMSELHIDPSKVEDDEQEDEELLHVETCRVISVASTNVELNSILARHYTRLDSFTSLPDQKARAQPTDMKLRIRSTATKETIRIHIPNSSSLSDVKTLISSNLSSTTPIPPESIHLSLNRTDEIAAAPDESLHALGLTSGDLLFYSLDSSLNSTTETLNKSPASPVENLTSFSSAPEPPTDDMEVESESEPFEQEKAASVPCFLRRIMEAEKGKINGNMGLTVVAIHAVFLESGFVACSGGGGSSLPEGCAMASHLVSVKYTLPDLISCGNLEEVKNVILKFSSVGNHVSIYGRLVGARPDVYHLSLDSSMLAPLLALAVNELSAQEQEDVFQLWKIVKDCLSIPLLIDICQKNGLPLPPCFTRLPTDLKIMILEFLPGIDLARAACACSELRYLSSNDELWKRRFLEEFKIFVEGSTGGTWKDKFARLWVRRKKFRMDLDNALVPYIRSPRVIPLPWIPGAQRFPMIGGDYDRFPAIGDLGSQRRAEFNQYAATRKFSPNCNFGGGAL